MSQFSSKKLLSTFIPSGGIRVGAAGGAAGALTASTRLSLSQVAPQRYPGHPAPTAIVLALAPLPGGEAEAAAGGGAARGKRPRPEGSSAQQHEGGGALAAARELYGHLQRALE